MHCHYSQYLIIVFVQYVEPYLITHFLLAFNNYSAIIYLKIVNKYINLIPVYQVAQQEEKMFIEFYHDIFRSCYKDENNSNRRIFIDRNSGNKYFTVSVVEVGKTRPKVIVTRALQENALDFGIQYFAKQEEKQK